jgi:hypothetical protein
VRPSHTTFVTARPCGRRIGDNPSLDSTGAMVDPGKFMVGTGPRSASTDITARLLLDCKAWIVKTHSRRTRAWGTRPSSDRCCLAVEWNDVHVLLAAAESEYYKHRFVANKDCETLYLGCATKPLDPGLPLPGPSTVSFSPQSCQHATGSLSVNLSVPSCKVPMYFKFKYPGSHFSLCSSFIISTH